ncbi:hypothetical protein ABKA04_006988 [Annulohypoxylon sp. FPYF3050]
MTTTDSPSPKLSSPASWLGRRREGAQSVTNTPPETGEIISHANDSEVGETEPLLGHEAPAEEGWKPPPHFMWIEIAIMANVFLSGFDGTITASTYAVISSEFDATNTASWLTTSYLVTSCAFQPIYGRVSDIFGRRICFFISTVTFAIGCLGCGLAQNIILLNFMRALTGVGGGGLMSMATIVNSDMIPFRKRGMYQAFQNCVFGFGAICGASLGGFIAGAISWRWCFLLQVPVSVIAFILGYEVIKNPRGTISHHVGLRGACQKVDFVGAFLLILAVSAQLVGLSLGGNLLPWKNGWVIGSLVGSVVLFALFFHVEAKTTAVPIIPLHMLKGTGSILTQISNACCGASAYAYLFMLPLFFQVVLLDSPAKTGARLAVLVIVNPIGGIIHGVVMQRYGKMLGLIRSGAAFMAIGNALVTSLQFTDATWKHWVYIFPASLGQGIVYPSILFIALASFEHADHAVSASTVIDAIRHSVTALKELPPDIQLQARQVYYQGLQYSFAASTASAVIATIAALLLNGKGIRRPTTEI